MFGLIVVAGGLAASEDLPHYHRGKLAKYDLGPPSVLLSRKDEGRLRAGKAVMQAIVAEDGLTRRLVSVQDIPVPSSVVLGRIMDFNKYPEMVSGVEGCSTYSNSLVNQETGIRSVKSTYSIKALHMGLTYYIEHTYDPQMGCMTFCLDYDKRSDLDDSVGYWFVQPDGQRSCRVFYSCECKLRGWVPPPVYNLLTKEALKKATVWVSEESIKEWKEQRAGVARDPFLTFVENTKESFAAAFTALDIRVPSRTWAINNLQMLLPQPPRRAVTWLEGRRRDAVRMVDFALPGRRAVRAPPPAEGTMEDVGADYDDGWEPPESEA